MHTTATRSESKSCSRRKSSRLTIRTLYENGHDLMYIHNVLILVQDGRTMIDYAQIGKAFRRGLSDQAYDELIHILSGGGMYSGFLRSSPIILFHIVRPLSATSASCACRFAKSPVRSSTATPAGIQYVAFDIDMPIIEFVISATQTMRLISQSPQRPMTIRMCHKSLKLIWKSRATITRTNAWLSPRKSTDSTTSLQRLKQSEMD
jgi:hypothetical protein